MIKLDKVSSFLWKIIYRDKIRKTILPALFGILAIFSIFTYYSIKSNGTSYGPDPSIVMGWLLADLTVLLSIAILYTRRFFRLWFEKKSIESGAKLQNRIVMMFCLVAAVPTLVISIFSSYFFNFGVQSWFDQKITAVIDKSTEVARSYIEEHKREMKATALSIEDDLDKLYYKLSSNPQLFSTILDGQADMRSLNEAIVFQTGTNLVLAKASLSFSLAFTTIPGHFIERADRGEIVDISTDPTRIRILIKLREYNNSYLLIGRLIDKGVIDQIDQTDGALEEYKKLKRRITNMQIKFGIIFILITLLLLVGAIIAGVIFASKIVSPIKRLLLATRKVQEGNLSTRVNIDGSGDEISTLSSAFNDMVERIDTQQKELVVAQRYLAWSDVARRVAHEIKNPLTPIQLSTERLSKKFSSKVDDKEEFIKYTKTILRHTESIGRIISDFVNFAKMPTPSFEKTDIVKLVSDAVDSYKLTNDGIKYIFATNVENYDFTCDPTQMNQVLVNLFKNASEAFEGEGEKLVYTSVFKDCNLLTISVKDNGPGISEDMLSKITEAYITTKTKGTGLGLAIVKKIVQDHCGYVEVKNDNGAEIKLIFDLEKPYNKINQ